MDPPAFVANEDGSIVSDQSPPAQIQKNCSISKPDQLSDNKDTESGNSPVVKKQIKSVLKSSKYSTAPPIINAPNTIEDDDNISDDNNDNDTESNNDTEHSISLSSAYTSSIGGSSIYTGGGSYSSSMYDGPYSLASTQQAGNTTEQRKSSTDTIATYTIAGGEKVGSDDKNEDIIPASAVAVAITNGNDDGNQQPSEPAKITSTEDDIAAKKEKQKKQFFAVSISLLLLLILIFGLVFGLKKDNADDTTIDESNNLRGEVESVPTVQPVTSPPWLDHWILETALEPVDPNAPVPLNPNFPIEDTTKEDIYDVQDDVPTINSSTMSTPSSPTTTTTTTILTNGNCADVINATALRSDDGTWTFDVTISSPYESGWGQYADEFQIISISDDIILGTRSLAHPHPNEQPFTRSLGGIIIPNDLSMVSITARDSINGYCGEVFDLELPSSMIQQETTLQPTSEPSQQQVQPTSQPSQQQVQCGPRVKVCPDGTTVVGRDPNNNCRFFLCPNALETQAPVT